MSNNPLAHIDDRLFLFNVSIASDGGGHVSLSKTAIKHMEITDDLLFPFHHGFMIVDNTYNYLDDVINLRHDDRDFVVLDIMQQASDSRSEFNDESLKEIFALKGTFTIYKTEDVAGTTYPNSLKKIFFRDTVFQFMFRNKSFFHSSNLVEDATKLKSLNNSERSFPTGMLCKEIIKSDCEVGDEAFTDDFSIGDPDLSNLFHTSSTDTTTWDNIVRFLSLHIDENEEKDSCILRLERGKNKFSLMPLSKYFKNQIEKPGEYNLESTFLGGAPGTPTDTNAISTYLPDFSGVENFKVSSIRSLDMTDKFRTTIPVTMDMSQKHTHLKYSENYIDKVFDDFNKLYVKPFDGIGAGPALPSITVDDFRREMKSYKYVPTPYPKNQSTAIGRNRMLSSMLFLNNNITLNMRGYTHRQSGRFIDIHKGSNLDNKGFDNKVIGRWFVTHVTHIFDGDKYLNRIEGIKPYYNNISF